MQSSSAAASGPYRSGGIFTWPRRAEAWLDSKGRGAWIAAMVLGFVFFWPLGLFLVLYITYTHRWSHDMFGSSCRARRAMHHDDARPWSRGWDRGWDRAAFRPSGNAVFDSYRAETLRRLEEEQEAFESFLQRLREAKDKKEFDAFMDERARMTRDAGTAEAEAAAKPAPEAASGDDTLRRGEY